MAGLCEGFNEPPSSLKASNKIPVSRAVASWSEALCLGLALRNARWFESPRGKTFSHEISASVWDRCPPSIVMRNPVAKASYNGWRAHCDTHTIPPFWLDDRPPLLQYLNVRPEAGSSVWALQGLWRHGLKNSRVFPNSLWIFS
ncbi:hypothetical protein ANN_09215 [Periplaneta americana]|uniref:Uncharacterized protein n=1 Tax=Periplaneta americana TaxID=6978 RepID=A0ABQ8TMY8_PERAM|nr:hypothetical protein ANN_09215 [Periplaneta americana]